MPYTAEHKAETRARIVTSARKLFNRRGFVEVSIEEIMADAGLTRGGFYNHFDSKEALYAEAVTAILACKRSGSWHGMPIDIEAPPQVLARQIIGAYLSDGHFADVEASCPLIALPSDVARGGGPVKRAYCRVLNAMIGLFQKSQEDHSDARARAVTMAILCVGGMVLARAVDDAELGAEIRRVAMNGAFAAGAWEGASKVAAE